MRNICAKEISSRLCNDEVIPGNLKTKIANSDTAEKANILLYGHLKAQANCCALTTTIHVITDIKGYPKMKEVGQRMEVRFKEYVQLCSCPKHTKK